MQAYILVNLTLVYENVILRKYYQLSAIIEKSGSFGHTKQALISLKMMYNRLRFLCINITLHLYCLFICI
jgi:hypothetical protein